MGVYLNPGDKLFRRAINSEIYVDKTELIAYTNKVLDTEQQFVCVSRPRRFGKSMAANMLAAYYDRTTDAAATFKGLKIAATDTFTDHCNKYDVLQINMQDFLSGSNDIDELIRSLKKHLLWDLTHEYHDCCFFDSENLVRTLTDVYANTKRPFVVIIDEWDCVFREYQDRKDWQRKYLDFLRNLLKDKAYVALAYMTGILPIKKYGTHSALNMFNEFSMENPRELAQFVGFTAAELRDLCARFNRNYEECRAWYDGYRFAGVGEIYNPRSVVTAISSGVFDTYWNQTETFEALKIYIDMNYDGLREAVIALMSGERPRIDTTRFVNDMTTFGGKDDVLTLLIHLGYLGYDYATGRVFIPNNEIRREYGTAVSVGGWDKITAAVQKAEDLLTATLNQDAAAVAKGIEDAHFETSHLQYNDENALSYTLSLAYYTARQKYIVMRELPTGKGVADLVFLPRPLYATLPAFIVELKWDKSTTTAIAQIKAKEYPKLLADYTGDILLVGVSYDKATRKHDCVIECWKK